MQGNIKKGKYRHDILFPKLFWPIVRKNYSNDSKFEAEGREFANFLRLLERFSELVNVQYVQFLKQYAFFTCSWSFLRIH